MAATFSSIITTEEFNAYMQESVAAGDDKFLDFKQKLITGCVDEIERYTGLLMASANYTETFNGNGSGKIFLRNHPVNSVASISLSGSVVAATEYYLSTQMGNITFRSPLTSGFQNYSVTYNAGYGLTLVPQGIKDACAIWTAAKYRKSVSKSHGISAVNMGGQSVTYFAKDMPEEVKTILDLYRMPIRSFSA